jgi:hypothetical protein
MDMVSFVTGGITVLMTYAFYSIGREDDNLEVEIIELENETGIVVNDSSGRLHNIYCENCRKKKKHRETRPRVFECTRCKRTTDLRIPS